MKKNILYSLFASISIISVAAYAEGESAVASETKTAILATKNYVDAGLGVVYTAAKGLVDTLAENNTTSLATKASQAGLDSEIANRQNADAGLSNRIETLEGNLGSTSANGIAEKYATKDGVANTINTATVTVPVGMTWGSSDVTNVVAVVESQYGEPEAAGEPEEPGNTEEPGEPTI